MNKEILYLALPSIISNITVPLLGLVDLTIVGHIGNEVYISAIATGSMIFNVIYWIFGFLRMGTSGMTAQAYGRQSGGEARQMLRLSVSTGAAIGAFFILIQVLLLRFMLWAMNTPVDAAPFVTQYFNIVIWGAPAMLSLYAFNGWFIGMQDTRTPMVIAIIQNVINIIASLSLVYLAGWKIAGVAAGTLIAQWSGALMALAAAVRKIHSVRIFAVNENLSDKQSSLDLPSAGREGTRPSPATSWGDNEAANSQTHELTNSNKTQKLNNSQTYKLKLKSFFTVNRDIFLRTICLVAVNMFFTSAGGRQGSLILAVNALLMTLYTLFSYFMDGFAYAGEALCGKYYGAGDKVSFHRTIRSLNIWGVLMVVLFTLLYLLGGRSFLSLLTSDTAVVDAAMSYLPWAIAIPVCGVMAFIYDGIFVGITATKGMLLSSFSAAVIFFILYFSLSGTLGNNALWIAFLAFLIVRGVVEFFFLKFRERV